MENPILRYCAWAVSRNFLASNNVGTGGQEARLLSHRYTHSLDKVPDANLAGLCFCGSAKREMPGKLAYISIMSSVSYQGNPPPIFLITLIKSCPHWRVVFFFFFRSEISPPPTFFFLFLSVLGHLSDILLVCSSYRRGQWAGHQAHPNFGFLSSLPPPLFWVCLSVVCPRQRRDPPPPCMQEESSGNGI